MSESRANKFDYNCTLYSTVYTWKLLPLGFPSTTAQGHVPWLAKVPPTILDVRDCRQYF